MINMFLKGTQPVDADHDRSLLAGAVLAHQTNYQPHTEGMKLTYRDDILPSQLERVREQGMPVIPGCGPMDYFSPIVIPASWRTPGPPSIVMPGGMTAPIFWEGSSAT